MANVLKHRFVSPKADGPDASMIQPSYWNDGHSFTGGAAGSFLMRDTADASFGASWNANVARTDAQNLFTQGQYIYAENPALYLSDPDSPVDLKTWRYVHHHGTNDSRIEKLSDTGAVLSQFVFQGDSSLLVYGKLLERGRTTAIGDWINPTFNPADFTASGATWNVTGIVSWGYTLIGKTLIFSIKIGTSTLSAPSASLNIKLPAAAVADRQGLGTCWSSAPAWEACFAHVTMGTPTITIHRPGIQNFPAAVNIELHLSVVVAIQ